PMVECQKCKEVFKADQLLESETGRNVGGLPFPEMDAIIADDNIVCPDCDGKLSKVFSFNLMFKTNIGPGSKNVGYLRPETAQGIFTLFNRLYSHGRKKLPFGVTQLGRAYRNEISPRQGVIRLREFSQAEAEVFVHPDEKTHPKFERYADVELKLVPQDKEEIRITARDAAEKGIVGNELLCYHLILVKRFLEGVGLPEEDTRFRQHIRTEMAHYAADCWDAEVKTERFGWIEVVGIADRTDYDLMSHEEHSKIEHKAFIPYAEPKIMKRKALVPKVAALGKEFKAKAKEIVEFLQKADEEVVKSFEKNGYIDVEVQGAKIRLGEEYVEAKVLEEKAHGEKITPHIIEPSYGIDRILYCILEKAYNERDKRKVMSFNPSIAPLDVAVFPLVSKEELIDVTAKIVEELKGQGLLVIYDDSDTIGRRYSRVDEIGVPYSITVDFDSLEDESVTIRDRDSMAQMRVKITGLVSTIQGLRSGEVKFEGQ
ncbi:MAG: glycine--tRNA ligase, partial [Candidatus Hydrothermarchaeales archaeon]